MISGLDLTDPETPIGVVNRFGITTLTAEFSAGTGAGTGELVASMPIGGMTNPFTGQPSIAGLAILVDDVAGRVNFYRTGGDQWTVSSELTVELTPDAYPSLLSEPDEPVIASARGIGGIGSPLLSLCDLTHAGTVIGVGTVRTLPLNGGPDAPVSGGADPLIRTASTTLADLMSVEAVSAGDGSCRLHQRPDPILNNLIGIVHGGVSGAGLELVAAAAVNLDRSEPLRTGTIRVNFLRPFAAATDSGAQSFYEGSVLRAGRNTAVADARAIGADGKVAVIARLTAYR